MKAYSKYFLMALLVLTLTNCNKDDDSAPPAEPTTAELLIGKWFVEERNNTKVPEGCLDQSYYYFFDEQNMVSEQFFPVEFSCLSSGLYASSYTMNDENEVVFEVQDDILGITTVTLEIIEISTTELKGTLQDRFGGIAYKLIKQQ